MIEFLAIFLLLMPLALSAWISLKNIRRALLLQSQDIARLRNEITALRKKTHAQDDLISTLRRQAGSQR